MKVAKVIKACKSRVGDGSEYLWECYTSALSLGLYNHKVSPIGSVTYNYQTGKVYELSVEIDENTGFRWINPKFVQAYNDECGTRNIDPTEAWDGVKWIDVDETAIMSLLKSAYYGETIDVNKYSSVGNSPVSISATYVVTLIAKHEFEIKARSMVAAIDLAKNFVNTLSPTKTSYTPTDTLIWSDVFICSEIVQRQYEALDFPVINTRNEQFTLPSEPTADQPIIQYNVSLLLNYTFDVTVDTMENATEQAKTFINLIRPSTTWGNDVVWVDSYITSETVERKIEND
jgi:hypothetical protein